jgi:glycosyltransferase involved in cell wall biosynthesis
MRLSIISPYYDCLNYIKSLRNILEPQLNSNVEWLIIDDGCREEELDEFNAKVIHLEKNSGCAGIPRNYGLDVAQGEYITFVDSDDLISNDFIKKIFEKIDNEDFDYCLMSWKSDTFNIDVTNGRPEWNCSVWGIVYKKDLIGDYRFNNLRIGEDYNFNINVLKGKCSIISDYLYYYRSNEKGIMSNVGKSS